MYTAQYTLGEMRCDKRRESRMRNKSPTALDRVWSVTQPAPGESGRPRPGNESPPVPDLRVKQGPTWVELRQFSACLSSLRLSSVSTIHRSVSKPRHHTLRWCTTGIPSLTGEQRAASIQFCVPKWIFSSVTVPDPLIRFLAPCTKMQPHQILGFLKQHN